MSLQEQLIKAGLADSERLRKVKREQQQAQRQQRQKGGKRTAAPTPRPDPAANQKRARDQALEQKRKEKAARKEAVAQIRQLIESNQVARDMAQATIAYHFTVNNKISKIHVSPEQQRQLIAGTLSVTRLDGHLLLIPTATAERIRERLADWYLFTSQPDAPAAESDPDDPYAKYQVPDDLMW